MYEETQDLLQESIEDSINRTFSFSKKDPDLEMVR
jgi:hypothetical protein